MKETGIMMSGSHPLDIIEGRKTQTRRVIVPQPDDSYSHIETGYYHPTRIDKDGNEYPGDEIFGAFTDDGEWGLKCPYGGPGDRLWVRETWCIAAWTKGRVAVLLYKADGVKLTLPWNDWLDAQWETKNWDRWRSSRFMPRWASRIVREITEVRAERLWDISEPDVLQEATPHFWDHPEGPGQAFIDLWDDLNAKRGHGWEKNDWVWPITFRLLEPGASKESSESKSTGASKYHYEAKRRRASKV